MSGNDCWNSCCRKADNELADVTLSGRLCQNCAAATRNARPPMVDSLNGGIHKRFDPAERSAGRPDTSATWTNELRYRDAPPCRALCVRTAILYSICSGARNQWRLISASVMWSRALRWYTDRQLHWRPTGADVTGKPAGRPARYFRSPVGSGPKQPPTFGVWLLVVGTKWWIWRSWCNEAKHRATARLMCVCIVRSLSI